MRVCESNRRPMKKEKRGSQELLRGGGGGCSDSCLGGGLLLGCNISQAEATVIQPLRTVHK